jgi:hypothetical protein
MNGYYPGPGFAPPSSVIFPPNLTIGDSWAFEMDAGEYGTPSSAGPWTATLTFASGTVKVPTNATLQANIFYWLVPPSATSTLPAGTLVWTIAVSNPVPERYTLQEGTVTALPDISDPNTSVPTGTMLEQQLAACDATLLQLLSQRTSSVTFAGKSYTLWDISKLWAVRNDLYMRVQEERAALSGNPRSRIIIPVFKNPWGGPYPWYPYPYV